MLEFTATTPLGISVNRRTMKAMPVNGVRIIIDKDLKFTPIGWRIITGYPQK